MRYARIAQRPAVAPTEHPTQPGALSKHIFSSTAGTLRLAPIHYR